MLRHLVPLVHFKGAHPTTPLRDGAHAGFTVAVAVHLDVFAPTKGKLTLTGSWSSAAVAAVAVDFPSATAGATVRLNLTAAASDVELWWPVAVRDWGRGLSESAAGASTNLITDACTSSGLWWGVHIPF